jgi:hypothetical protein
MQMCVGAENFLPTDMSVNKHVCPPKEICVRTTAIHNQEWALKKSSLFFYSATPALSAKGGCASGARNPHLRTFRNKRKSEMRTTKKVVAIRKNACEKNIFCSCPV